MGVDWDPCWVDLFVYDFIIVVMSVSNLFVLCSCLSGDFNCLLFVVLLKHWLWCLLLFYIVLLLIVFSFLFIGFIILEGNKHIA